MGSFREIREVANSRTYIAIVIAMMGALMFGIDQGNYGLASDFESFYDFWCKPYFMIDGYTCTAQQLPGITTPRGWVAFKALGGSLITLGAAAGCIGLGPLISSNCGRRLCISMGGMVCFIGCLFASYLTFNSITVYYIGRFVTGFGAGICCFALQLRGCDTHNPRSHGLAFPTYGCCGWSFRIGHAFTHHGLAIGHAASRPCWCDCQRSNLVHARIASLRHG